MSPSPRRPASRLAAPAVLLVLGGLALSACAGGPPRTPEKTLEQLSADCEARGGILVPTGRISGRDAVDNYCRINGGPSERLRPRN